MKASIVAVGSELCQGVVANENARFLSEKLFEMGAVVDLHLAVPDDRAGIREALALGSRSELLLVTGGLGPTSDDFTRDVIADWLGLPLLPDADSWRRIEERLRSRGVPVAEANRQQSVFPRGAQVIANPDGTADGFAIRIPGGLLIALPGPPREIRAIWESGVRSLLAIEFPDLVAITPRIWRCVGKSEAELGELTEKAIEGSTLRSAYRAESPAVEVKVWPRAGAEWDEAALNRLDLALAPWTVARDKTDLARALADKLAARNTPARIVEMGAGGYLAARLAKACRRAEVELVIRAGSDSPANAVRAALSEGADFALACPRDWERAGFRWAFGRQETPVREGVSPYRSAKLADRLAMTVCELALKDWVT